MTRPDEDEERVAEKADGDLTLSKQTLEDLDAPDEASEEAKGGTRTAQAASGRYTACSC